MARRILKGMRWWPKNHKVLTTQEVVKMYNEGYAGAFEDDEAREELDECINTTQKFKSADSLIETLNYAESGKDKLTLLFPAVVECFGYRALTRPGQKTGDCVSKMGRDTGLFSCCIDVVSKTPDEVSGKVEALPQVSDIAISNGVFANEGIYKNRGHNGQGMNCDQSVHWMMTKGGLVVRKDYTAQGGVNLESYNVNWSMSGRSGSPEWINEEGKKHQIRGIVRPKNFEQARDIMATTKAILGTCSSLGFSSKRDENGFSQRSGSWGHSWHIAGWDSRKSTIAKYGDELALFGHRWAAWNSGPRAIRDSREYFAPEYRDRARSLGMLDTNGNVLIPEGYCWIKASLLNQCWMAMFTSVSGWPSRELPNVQTVLG
jgi:hypothetical protein